MKKKIMKIAHHLQLKNITTKINKIFIIIVLVYNCKFLNNYNKINIHQKIQGKVNKKKKMKIKMKIQKNLNPNNNLKIQQVILNQNKKIRILMMNKNSHIIITKILLPYKILMLLNLIMMMIIVNNNHQYRKKSKSKLILIIIVAVNIRSLKQKNQVCIKKKQKFASNNSQDKSKLGNSNLVLVQKQRKAMVENKLLNKQFSTIFLFIK